MAYQYKYIAASGTFDHLHNGHKAFLKKAFKLSRKVLIGITSDAYVEKKRFAHLIELFEKRKANVVAFLRQNEVLDRTEIFKLEDMYGPALNSETNIEAILVTEKTIANADEINRKRQELGLSLLTIIKIPLVKTEDGEVFSSTTLRKNLVLPLHIRPMLQIPLGTLLKGTEENLQTAVLAAKELIEEKKPTLVVTVGDVVTSSFNKAGILINLAIVDFKIKRKETFKSLSELGFTKSEPDITVENKPGTISHELSTGVKKMIETLLSQKRTLNHESIIIKVLGEEDLAVIPATIYSPNNTLIFYGQPDEGIVAVHGNDEIKRKTEVLLSKFTT